MTNPFGLNPVKVENYLAYPKGSPHYGKIKLLLTYNPFKEGEVIDIDTEDFQVRGTIEKIIEKRTIIVKMIHFAHKEVIN